MFVNNLRWWTLFLVLVLAFLSFMNLAKAQEVERTLSFGLAKDSAWDTSEHRRQMAVHGLLDHAVVFYNLTAPDNVRDPYGWVKTEYIDRNIPVVLTLIFSDVDEDVHATSEGSDGATTSGVLKKVSSGFYDEELARLAIAITNSGWPIVVRPLHEADGNWYEWGMYADGNTPEDYVAAFVHVVEVFRAAKAPVRFELNLNRRDGASPSGVLTDIDRWFSALDPYVDMYSISSYNRCKTNADSYQEWRSFTEEFEPAYAALSQKTAKPINVAEVATTDLCGPKLSWYVNMISDIEVMFSQVEMVTFYFGTVPIGAASNDVPIEWGFPTDSQRESFAIVLMLWREYLANE